MYNFFITFYGAHAYSNNRTCSVGGQARVLLCGNNSKMSFKIVACV